MPIKPGYEKFLEGHANQLRLMCQLPPFARLDPFILARKMNMLVSYVDETCGLPVEMLGAIFDDTGGSWDAGTLKLPDGRVRVFMNPTKIKERQHATLMEEIAHIKLGHKPSEIVQHGNIAFRTVSKSTESQAYWLGATALLPTRILKGAFTLNKSVQQLAAEHQVSEELVRFRCTVAGISLRNEQILV